MGLKFGFLFSICNPSRWQKPWATPEEMCRREGHMLFLRDPEEMVTKFKQRQAEVPITGTIMRVPPGMEHRKVLRCMELVARDVMPHFADEPASGCLRHSSDTH